MKSEHVKDIIDISAIYPTNKTIYIILINLLASIIIMQPCLAESDVARHYTSTRQSMNYKVSKDNWGARKDALKFFSKLLDSYSAKTVAESYFNDSHTLHIIRDIGSRLSHGPSLPGHFPTRGGLFEVNVFKTSEGGLYIPNDMEAIAFLGDGSNPLDAMMNNLNRPSVKSDWPSGVLKDYEASWYVWGKYEPSTGQHSFENITYPENISLYGGALKAIENRVREEVEAEKKAREERQAELQAEIDRRMAPLKAALEREQQSTAKLPLLRYEIDQLNDRLRNEQFKAERRQATFDAILAERKAEYDKVRKASEAFAASITSERRQAADALAAAERRARSNSSSGNGTTSQRNDGMPTGGGGNDGGSASQDSLPGTGGQRPIPNDHWIINGRDAGKADVVITPGKP